MKRLTKAVAVLSLVCTLVLTACGAAKTAEDYYSKPLVKKAMEAEFEQQVQESDVFTKIEMVAKGNDITYNYYFIEGIVVDPDLLVLDDATFDQVKELLKEECGVLPDTLTYSYYYSDGTLVKSLSH